VDSVRTLLADVLTDHLGTVIEPDLPDDWLTAHVALRAVEWALDAAGRGPVTCLSPASADALAGAHRRQELRSDRPTPVRSYVGLIEEVLGADLGALPAAPDARAPVRFGAPNDEDLIRSIREQADFAGRFDPLAWVIQRRVGRPPRRHDPSGDLDRFMARWSYARDVLSPWVEVGRDDAFAHVVAVRRVSLADSVARGRRVARSWAPGPEVAGDRAAR
jgi:hypothetical protein